MSVRGGARARPALDWASVNMTSLAEESWSCRLVNLARGGDGESVTLYTDLHLAEKSSPSMKSNIVSLLFSHKQLSSPWLRWLDTQDTD